MVRPEWALISHLCNSLYGRLCQQLIWVTDLCAAVNMGESQNINVLASCMNPEVVNMGAGS